MTKFEVKYVETNVESLRDQYGKFIIEPLELGQGITIGNALRRALLGDVEGSAITSLRIDGVNHEFSIIPGIREDVLEIVLNLKELVLKNQSKHSVTGKLKMRGPCIIKAANLKMPSDILVIDPEQYIATICDPITLEMEFKIDNGRGYKLIREIMDDDHIDFFHVDAVFMPVKKVNYNVEEIKISPEVFKDKLTLEIWTNGSISPKEALEEAAHMLIKLFIPFKSVDFKPEEEKEEIPILDSSQVNQIMIEELQLSVRSYNCLKKISINNIADLLKYSLEDLIQIRNFGATSASEVELALQKRLGITLPQGKKIKPLKKNATFKQK